LYHKYTKIYLRACNFKKFSGVIPRTPINKGKERGREEERKGRDRVIKEGREGTG
jgi:hypothetical protein